MLIIHYLFALFLPAFIGFRIQRHFFKQMPLLFQMAIAWALGWGFLGFLILLLDYFDLHLSALSITVACLLCWLSFEISMAFVKTKSPTPASFDMPMAQPLSTLKKTLLITAVLYIIYQVFFVTWFALHTPIVNWDGFWQIALKGKAFFYRNSLRELIELPLPYYGLLTSLSFSWISWHIGFWDDLAIKIIFPLYFLSFVIIFYYGLRSLTNNFLAWIGTALCLSSLLLINHACTEYNDFPLLYYTCISWLLCWWGLRSGSSQLLLFAGITAGMGAFVKLEGIDYAVILLIAALFVNHRSHAQKVTSSAIAYYMGLSALVPILLFVIYKATHGMSPVIPYNPLSFSADAWPHLISAILKQGHDLFLSGNWGNLWPLLIVLLVVNQRIWKKASFTFFTALLGLFFLHLLIAAVFTQQYTYIAGEKSITALSRMILHFFPLCPILITLLLAELQGKNV